MLYVAASHIIGGAELTQLNVLRCLQDRGVLIRAIVPEQGQLGGTLRSMGVEVRSADLVTPLRLSRLGSRRAALRAAISFASAYAHAVKRHATCTGAAVVYAGGLRAHLGTYRLLGPPRRDGGRPRVAWHAHEILSPFPGDRLYRYLAGRADLLIAVSQAVARQDALSATRRLVVVLNGVPRSFFDVRLPSLDVPELVVGMVGHLTPGKGHDEVLGLVARLRSAGLPVRASLVGGSVYESAPNQAYAQSLRARLPSWASMEILSPDQMPARVASWQLLAHLPSTPEGFGRAVAEAQAAGLPCVVYDSGALGEIVRNGVTGFVVPRERPELLNAASYRLLTDPDVFVRMSRAARRNAEERFTAERAGREAADALLGLLPSNRTGAV